MYYIWTISEKYPNLYWLNYDWENNPDHLQFIEEFPTTSLPKDERIVLNLSPKTNKETFLKYDYVLSDAINLISERFARLMTEIAADDIKIIKSEIFQNNNFIGFYYIPVILNVVSCIDKKKSIYGKDVGDYTKLCFKKDSLKNHLIVRAKGYEDDGFIVTKKIVDACAKENIKGVDFFEEPYLNPLYR